MDENQKLNLLELIHTKAACQIEVLRSLWVQQLTVQNFLQSHGEIMMKFDSVPVTEVTQEDARSTCKNFNFTLYN